jgi:hypothetical protein
LFNEIAAAFNEDRTVDCRLAEEAQGLAAKGEDSPRVARFSALPSGRAGRLRER